MLQPEEQETFEQLLEATRGTWRGGDGLLYQREIRREWDEQISSLACH
jgi:hypothetical protein